MKEISLTEFLLWGISIKYFPMELLKAVKEYVLLKSNLKEESLQQDTIDSKKQIKEAISNLDIDKQKITSRKIKKPDKRKLKSCESINKKLDEIIHEIIKQRSLSSQRIAMYENSNLEDMKQGFQDIEFLYCRMRTLLSVLTIKDESMGPPPFKGKNELIEFIQSSKASNKKNLSRDNLHRHFARANKIN